MIVNLSPNGTSTIDFFAVDAAGNWSTNQRKEIIHDDQPPGAANGSFLRAFYDGTQTVVEGNAGSVEGYATVEVQDLTTLSAISTAQATSS